ncbi:putative Protease inhibitor/seed storage/lipid transfer family protein [Cocos nucifera]|nr:putative Protease inhibitor/seed storage/lipid transfer family protein [Cocos nucifera]
MAKNSMLGLALALAFAVTGSLPSGAHAEGGCQQDFDALVKQCSAFVQKTGPFVPPSAQCCSVIQHADIPCVCKYITPKVEKLISMEKVVYILKQCGRPLKHGSKCGSRITSHPIISLRQYNCLPYFILSTITTMAES